MFQMVDDKQFECQNTERVDLEEEVLDIDDIEDNREPCAPEPCLRRSERTQTQNSEERQPLPEAISQSQSASQLEPLPYSFGSDIESDDIGNAEDHTLHHPLQERPHAVNTDVQTDIPDGTQSTRSYINQNSDNHLSDKSEENSKESVGKGVNHNGETSERAPETATERSEDPTPEDYMGLSGERTANNQATGTSKISRGGIFENFSARGVFYRKFRILTGSRVF